MLYLCFVDCLCSANLGFIAVIARTQLIPAMANRLTAMGLLKAQIKADLVSGAKKAPAPPKVQLVRLAF